MAESAASSDEDHVSNASDLVKEICMLPPDMPGASKANRINPIRGDY